MRASWPSGIALALALSTPAMARAPQALPTAQLEAQVADTFCAGEEAIEGQLERYVLHGSDRCPKVRRETRRQRAIEHAIDDANPVLSSFDSEELTRARAIEHADARRSAYLQALLTDAANARALWSALEAHGYVRSDAAPLAPPVRREVAWQAFEPYVIAFAWPDPVVTPRAADGSATDKAKFSLHVCAGINGIQSIAEPDPLLARVAFVATIDSEFTSLIVPLFRAIVAELRKGPARTDDELTALARTRMAEAMQKSAPIRKTMCRAVAKREPEFGVHLTGC